jgi:hypothetical protein
MSDRAGCPTTFQGSKAMREVHCPHCNATNRRPKCASCQKEIADPPAIALVWKLYQHRKVVGTASAILALTLLFWRPWETFSFFYPANYSDCQEQAARSAWSNDAILSLGLFILRRLLLTTAGSLVPSRFPISCSSQADRARIHGGLGWQAPDSSWL